MDEKELQRLYNAINPKFDIGDFNTFRNKMQTPDNRKKFYDAVSSNGFDLGEYNSYEERLSGSKKKRTFWFSKRKRWYRRLLWWFSK